MSDDEPTEVEMQDGDAVEEEHMMYGHGNMTEEELNSKYPNRPHNHSKTLPFHELFLTLFNPLNENKKKPTGPVVARKKQGPHGPGHAPNEIRRSIIDRFISRWRKEVGNDIYPAFRLIVPEKDRDRAMYGLKEMTLAKLLVRVMKIDKNSEDAQNLLHWKLPGVKSSSAMAGDFAGRCFEVISKRPMRTTPGDMTIAEVNELLDRLSVAQKEENQRPIIEQFYTRMNAEELMWLVRMILRQMKVGATEKTIFDIWHPDAENLFNISSSLRRVCWELYDPQFRLKGDNRGINLMQCFQPQLAAFQMKSMEQMVSRMNPTEEDPVFWIEEKLDGERMQLHMMEDDEIPGGMRFGFWSRKAKDYTYLYGNGFEDDNAALTRHVRSAFSDGVRNIILDGEMITWDPKEDAAVPFGTLKTAAISEQQNPFSDGNRPLYRVFDCLYLNDVNLTRYTLRKRREALNMSISSIHRRLEVHEYQEAQSASQIEPLLRQVVAQSTEGLVLKNPRSIYRLNERNDDWIKVKPEYMTEFGEALDCVVVGGYYGSGKRGGFLSSYLCGLRLDGEYIQQGANPQKCYSFFKVGGGFSADDYRQMRHLTEGKWHDWDPKKPPIDWVELAGGDRQHERPDVWIKPENSVVIAAKAAQVTSSDQFRTGVTLRFPRFQKIKNDKDWKSALSLGEFLQLKYQVEEEQKDKQFKVDDERRKTRSRKRKKEVEIQGQNDGATTPYAGPATKVFDGLNFFIMTEAAKPIKKTKTELEQFVKSHGGNIVASEKDPSTILIADRNLVKVASLRKDDKRNLVRPSWLIDCVKQSELDIGRPSFLLPFEPQQLFYTAGPDAGKFDDNVDEYGDSYAKDVTSEELLALFNRMPSTVGDGSDPSQILDQLNQQEHELDSMPGWMFHGTKVYCSDTAPELMRILEFAGGDVVESLEDEELSHVVVPKDSARLKEIRKAISSRRKVPRIVTLEWVSDSWQERTRLDEERKLLRILFRNVADA
ncbi:DNA ligase (ATP) [Vermiconidia calcicola]|uniref:DNA ligase (ATP) n=1 Tax=Vermiconidia calcicola TaxID=1690605 RepID=A0ACC3MTE5_9PEZI|nr:DNA ligase (ATP) [Vermiconidia calcicola]